MAEAALFTLASKVLATIATPAFKKAYERAQSISGAKDDLQELKKTIKSIQAVLLDAEKKHNDSESVKDWIGRVRDVLYDAEDLFDTVATNDLLLPQHFKEDLFDTAGSETCCMMRKKHFKEVKKFFSKSNPIASSDFIAKKVKVIMKDLRRISADMALFGFVKCESERPISGMRKGVETGSFVGPDEVIGRDDEKKRIVDFVYSDAYAERDISLFAIVGIGGMGKSALAQLIYKDARIRGDFYKRYWACISDIFDEKEVLGKIYQSMSYGEQYQGLSLDQIQSKIREKVEKTEKFILVLDDLWDEDTCRGSKLCSILSCEKAKGSKIVITTRHLTVAKAMRADETLELKGLSKDASWELFRRHAFTKEQENDPAWISIGKNILRKCVNVPLAIKSVAGLLNVKATIEEWKSLENEQLSKLGFSDNPIMSTLRLSYDHLQSHLKNCFAYFSLFPKDSRLDKGEVVHLWIAQGYITPKKDETLEMAGHACFMELVRMSFLEEVPFYYKFKMHDLIHDLAQEVAGGESCIITHQGMDQPHNKIRHVNATYKIEESSNTLPSFLEVDRLRSSLFTCMQSCWSQFDEHITKFKFLRALSLRKQGLKTVPSSIKELKHLRYLDLSNNLFTHLPDSITKLVNLITLDLSYCSDLKELPREIGELINLRHLINRVCFQLVCMPPTLGELTSLEHLSSFKVCESSDAITGFHALARLNIRGSLYVLYDSSVESWRDELLLGYGRIPDTLETLEIHGYPSTTMPIWWREITPASRLPKLESLTLTSCDNVNNLAPLRCLPFLKCLIMNKLPQLRYIEDNKDASTTPFFPSLCKLHLIELRNLAQWSEQNHSTTPTFPILSELRIISCFNLVSWPPLAPHLKELMLNPVQKELVHQFLSKPSTLLETLYINFCLHLTDFPGDKLVSLRELHIGKCAKLKNLRLPSPNVIEKFTIVGCPQIELWNWKRSVDWTSFTKLRLLRADEIPDDSKLPNGLQLCELQTYEYSG